MAIKRNEKTKTNFLKILCLIMYYVPMYYYIIPLDTTFRIEYTYKDFTKI